MKKYLKTALTKLMVMWAPEKYIFLILTKWNCCLRIHHQQPLMYQIQQLCLSQCARHFCPRHLHLLCQLLYQQRFQQIWKQTDLSIKMWPQYWIKSSLIIILLNPQINSLQNKTQVGVDMIFAVHTTLPHKLNVIIISAVKCTYSCQT